MRLSDAMANALLAGLIGADSMPDGFSQVWMGLSTNAPETDGGIFSEVSGAGYGRTLVAINGQAYPDFIGEASGREVANRKQIVFPKATSAYTVGGFGLFAEESGGSPFAVGNLGTKKNPKTVDIAEGALPMFEKDGAFNIYAPSNLEEE